MSKFNFEKYVPVPWRRGPLSPLETMAVGEIILVKSPKHHVAKRIKAAIAKHPNREYSWDWTAKPIAVRRDR